MIKLITPKILNRQQFIEELSSVLGKEKIASIVWADQIELYTFLDLTFDEIRIANDVASRHDGTARNVLDVISRAELLEKKKNRQKLLKSLCEKRRRGEKLSESEREQLEDSLLGL